MSRRDLQDSARADELLCRLADRLRRPGLSDFEAGFAKSILGQAKRGGPSWRPSERQRAVAWRIIASPADDGTDMVLLEPDDGGET